MPGTLDRLKTALADRYALQRRLGQSGIVLAGTMVLGCGTEPTAVPVTTSIAVTPAVDTLTSLGQTVQLAASARDAAGGTISGKSFTWASTDPDIAVVNASGLVTAVANGSTAVSASADGISGTAVVVVRQAVANVAVTPDTVTLVSLGDSVQLTATARDAAGATISDKSFTWASADPDIAIVSGSGLASAVANGSTAVSASADGISGTAVVVVRQAVANVAVTPDMVTLVSLGDSVQLTATARDARDNLMAGVTFLWGSADQAVATVGASGVVTAVANGASSISAGAAGVSGTAVVVVDQVATGLAFSAEPFLQEASVAMTPPIQVELRDARGRRVTDGADAVTLTIGANPCGVALGGTAVVGAVAGVARFENVAIPGAGLGYTLIASSGGLTRDTTAPFDVYARGVWAATGAMNVARRNHTATLLQDGRVLIAGWFTQAAELYDPAAGSFTLTGNTVYRHGQGATATPLADGTVLLVGGNGESKGSEIYAPQGGAFAAGPATSADREYHTATLLADGRVLLAGGQGPGPQTHAAAELFVPSSGSFVPTGSLIDHRSGHGALALPDGRVLIVGGTQTTTPGWGDALRSAEIYDPASGTFSATGSTRGAYGNPLLASLTDGTVLLTGDWFADTAEVYDPRTGVFTPLVSVAPRHAAGTASRMRDGLVLIAGGSKAIGPTLADTAALYYPTSRAFAPAGVLNAARQEHTATALSDGRVLVTGGWNNGELASAELYSFPYCTGQGMAGATAR